MENSTTLLEGSSDMEKGAYIGAIASLATADREASPEEIEYLTALCEAAKLSEQQTQAVLQAATQINADDVTRCLEILKTSELKYSFITDLIAFAKTDKDYAENEQQSVQKMAAYLGVEQNQVSLLDSFVEKATDPQTTPEQVADPSFLFASGLKEKMQSLGINGSSLLKGLFGIAAPLLLTKMLTGGLNRNRSGLGGLFGGGGGLFGSGGSMGGGLGSLFGMLSGGRGMGGMGNIFGNLFGGNRGW